jgi:hypothetical protein
MARAPRLAPISEPASMTPSVCAVIGTGRKPIWIAGTRLIAAISAAKSAI